MEKAYSSSLVAYSLVVVVLGRTGTGPSLEKEATLKEATLKELVLE